jgi:hypothetical protein
VRVAGPVSAAAAPTLSIPSTPVLTSDATQFADGLDARPSSTRSSVGVAMVRGTWDGSTLSATQARLGQHDDGGDGD